MKSKKLLLSLFTFVFLYAFSAAGQKDNAELKKMYEQDQSGRQVTEINWTELNKTDAERRNRVNELLEKQEVITGKDYYHAAMIFQHGNDTIASGMAVKLMKIALKKDSTVNRWLLAAAIDRDLMRKKKPQIYGTQFIKMGKEAKWELYTLDSTKVSDDERRYYRVETLAEQRAKLAGMNLKPISDLYTDLKTVNNVVEFIRKASGTKQPAVYNLTETSINDFGYQLLKDRQSEDALAVFKLNTELYPNGFNTFDSYGECLLKLGKKTEAIAAYQKSVDLNPQNENGIRALSELKGKP